MGDVRTYFANTGLMRVMWAADSDSAIRVTSRIICALLARPLLRKGGLEEPELRWLEDVTGTSSNEIFNSDITKRNLMNLKSFVPGVLSQGGCPTEHVISFEETISILIGGGGSLQQQLSVLVHRIQQDN